MEHCRNIYKAHTLEFVCYIGSAQLFCGLTVLAYIRIKGYRISINRRTIVAGLLLGLVYIAFVAANKLTTAANAIVLQFTDPIFIVIFSALFSASALKSAILLRSFLRS